MSKLTQWWWVRHAPVPDGGRIYGQRDLDCDCTDAGVFGALAREMPREAIWVTSQLKRTIQTAAAIRAAMKLTDGDAPRAVPALAEQNLGGWQGLNRQEFLASRVPRRQAAKSKFFRCGPQAGSTCARTVGPRPSSE